MCSLPALSLQHMTAPCCTSAGTAVCWRPHRCGGKVTLIAELWRQCQSWSTSRQHQLCLVGHSAQWSQCQGVQRHLFPWQLPLCPCLQPITALKTRENVNYRGFVLACGLQFSCDVLSNEARVTTSRSRGVQGSDTTRHSQHVIAGQSVGSVPTR